MASLDSILKSRDITLPTKVCLVKAVKAGEGDDSSSLCLCCLKSSHSVQVGKLSCELCPHFSTLWPLNKVCAELVSALVS